MGEGAAVKKGDALPGGGVPRADGGAGVARGGEGALRQYVRGDTRVGGPQLRNCLLVELVSSGEDVDGGGMGAQRGGLAAHKARGGGRWRGGSIGDGKGRGAAAAAAVNTGSSP